MVLKIGMAYGLVCQVYKNIQSYVENIIVKYFLGKFANSKELLEIQLAWRTPDRDLYTVNNMSDNNGPGNLFDLISQIRHSFSKSLYVHFI